MKTLIETYGSQGTSLPLSDISKYYLQHFGTNPNISRPLAAAIKQANYKCIRITRADNRGPFVVVLTSQEDSAHSIIQRKGGWPKGKRRNRESPIRKYSRKKIAHVLTSSASSSESSGPMVSKNRNNQDPMSPPNEEEIPKRKKKVAKEAQEQEKPALSSRRSSVVSTSNRTSDEPSKYHGESTSTLVHQNPVPPTRNTTTGLIKVEEEFEKQKLEAMQDSNAIALFQIKPPDNDEAGQELLRLMKLKHVKRLQQEIS